MTMIMKNRISILLAAAFLCMAAVRAAVATADPCHPDRAERVEESASPQPYSVRMMLSEMQRNPEASYLDGRNGKLKWNYTTGLELLSFMDVATRYDLDYPVEYVQIQERGV